MGAVMICIAVATLGIDVGWQPLPDGGVEYLIQIEPQTLDAIRTGQAIQSDIPTNMGDIRSFRITVGSKKLPCDASVTSRTSRPTTAPPKLQIDPGTKPLIQQSSATNETPKPDAAETPGSANAGDNKINAEKPTATSNATTSPPMTIALLGLFASFGGNIFLGWIVWDQRKRCQALLVRPAGI